MVQSITSIFRSTINWNNLSSFFCQARVGIRWVLAHHQVIGKEANSWGLSSINFLMPGPYICYCLHITEITTQSSFILNTQPLWLRSYFFVFQLKLIMMIFCLHCNDSFSKIELRNDQTTENKVTPTTQMLYKVNENNTL